MFTILSGAGLLYGFAGGGVYWWITGSGVVGEGGNVTPLGVLLWMGPVALLAAPLYVPPIGPFRRLWQPLRTITFGSETLSWSVGGLESSLPWHEVVDVYPDTGSCVVVGAGRREIVRLPQKVVDARRPVGTAVGVIRVNWSEPSFMLSDLIGDVIARRILAERGTPAT
jgi:hypothetical protein